METGEPTTPEPFIVEEGEGYYVLSDGRCIEVSKPSFYADESLGVEGNDELALGHHEPLSQEEEEAIRAEEKTLEERGELTQEKQIGFALRRAIGRRL